MSSWPVHAKIDGAVVVIGFGSIAKGLVHLIKRHFSYDPKLMVVVEPNGSERAAVEALGIRFIQQEINPSNYKEVLTPLLSGGSGRSFCVNLSVDTSSVAIMELARELNALYIDTVVEPWKGFYFDTKVDPDARSNYALRESLLEAKRRSPGGPTAVSCCGANPGMVSWLVKKALLDIAKDLGINEEEPKTRDEWARFAMRLGVKGVHVAERDTQHALQMKPHNTFINTWSAEGIISEGMQPAELGWGTHEKWMPSSARQHASGCGAAIYLIQPGGDTRVRTWTPTAGPHHGFLVTHNEAISISDYFTVKDDNGVKYRPTCHYAYHPCNDAILSLMELYGRAGVRQETLHVLREDEIAHGADELGVLIYGHAKNAYWFGTRLSIEEARELAPGHSATTMQVTSAVLAGMVWALENPDCGIVECEEMDFRRCMEIQRPYLGKVFGAYTEWTPLANRPGLFPEEIDPSDPWQFRNVLV
jgi:homospermidine synthase